LAGADRRGYCASGDGCRTAPVREEGPGYALGTDILLMLDGTIGEWSGGDAGARSDSHKATVALEASSRVGVDIAVGDELGVGDGLTDASGRVEEGVADAVRTSAGFGVNFASADDLGGRGGGIPCSVCVEAVSKKLGRSWP